MCAWCLVPEHFEFDRQEQPAVNLKIVDLFYTTGSFIHISLDPEGLENSRYESFLFYFAFFFLSRNSVKC